MLSAAYALDFVRLQASKHKIVGHIDTELIATPASAEVTVKTGTQTVWSDAGNGVRRDTAAGHSDILGRVKHMQSRLNTIQTSSNLNAKCIQDSKAVMIARVSKIENIVSDFQAKLEEMVDMQYRDKLVISTLTALLSSKCEPKHDFQSYRTKSLPNRQRKMSL